MLVWDLVSRRQAARLAQHHFSAITGLCFAPSGWVLVTAGRDKVRLTCPRSGFSACAHAYLHAHKDYCTNQSRLMYKELQAEEELGRILDLKAEEQRLHSVP